MRGWRFVRSAVATDALVGGLVGLGRSGIADGVARPARGADAFRSRPGRADRGGRLLPDVVRLVSRLARDRSLPRGVRLRLWLLLGYLASPVDIIPDFVPVVGYADDAIIVALTLRSVGRRAGADPLKRHWPGTSEGLMVVWRLAGLGNGATSDGV
jgi:uncharacterized membrane protein YkvA (DUF1232 family)